jgi:hypothetical protein
MLGHPKKFLLALAALSLATSCGEPRATAPKPTSLSQSSDPTLLECPTNTGTSTSSVIGLLGGELQIGATSVAIPTGALATPTLIQLTIPPSRFMEIDVTAVGFSSFLFQTPITVTIDYSRCSRGDIDRQTLHVYHIDPLTKQLLEDMGGIDDKISRRITFTTGHLSGYAVAN